MKPRFLRPLLVGASILMLAACGDKAPPQRKMPTPVVEVVTAHSQSVPVTRDLVGRLAATRTAQVRARVAGIILARRYQEGTDVKPGQVLFQIDPAPLKAALHAQQAALAQAEANAANAAATARRYQDLVKRHLIAQQDADTAEANARSTAAAVKKAQADVEQAKLNLGYATVTAPIAGRAGKAQVTEGALVGQGEATLLTTIEQVDPLYVNFSQSATALQQLQDAAALGKASLASEQKAKIEVMLPDGSVYGHAGSIDFSDLAVAPDTGAVSLRGVIPNPEHRLLPGMFVNIRLTLGALDNAFLLPQPVLQRDAKGAYVMVVGADNKVAQVRVETHGMTRQDWIVSGGLKDGMRVIVSGLQKVRPGAAVKVEAAGSKANGAQNSHAPAKS